MVDVGMGRRTEKETLLCMSPTARTVPTRGDNPLRAAPGRPRHRSRHRSRNTSRDKSRYRSRRGPEIGPGNDQRDRSSIFVCSMVAIL